MYTMDAFSTPRNRITTLILLAICALSAIGAAVAGINDRLGHDYIGTEHLLLGVIRSDPGLARSIAAQAGYEEGALLRRLDQLSPRQPKPVAQAVDMPLSERSSRVLTVARRKLSVELTPADLLVALISVDGVASQVLREFRVTESMVREQASGGRASVHPE